MTDAPSTSALWGMAREAGIGVEAAERLRDDQIVKIGWTPPISIADAMTMDIAPSSIATYEFLFRLQREADGWYVEGQGPVGPWEQVEGPFPDRPWLAAPRPQ